MAKNGLKPEIRFAGFTGAWEQRKLGDVALITMGQSPDGSTYSNTPTGYILVQGNADLKNGWVTPKIWTTQVTKKAYVGDLIMSVRAPAGEMGKTAYNVVIGRGVAAIKGNEFIYQNLVKMNMVGYWKKISCGSTFESLNSDNIKNAKIMIPTLNEQNRIGTFFKNLDHLITLHQRKCEKLVNFKKAMLEKMFPKDGTDVPKIRFAGFAGAWEQRELKDLCVDTYGGGTPRTVVTEYWNGNIAWIQSSDLAEDKLSNVVPKKSITKNGLKNSTTKLIPENSIAIVTRVGVGKLAFMPYKYTTSQDFLSLSKLKVDNWFGTYSIWKKLQSKLRSVQGTSIKGIPKKELLAMTIMIPTQKEEQAEIGDFFHNLDHLITLQQRELEQLKQIKKSLLDKMFV